MMYSDAWCVEWCYDVFSILMIYVAEMQIYSDYYSPHVLVFCVLFWYYTITTFNLMIYNCSLLGGWWWYILIQ